MLSSIGVAVPVMEPTYMVIEFSYIRSMGITLQGTETFLDGFYRSDKANNTMYVLSTETHGQLSGQSVPVCMMIIKPGSDIGTAMRHMLQYARTLGDPLLCHSDKERAEYASVLRQWPMSQMRLCLFHVLKSIRDRAKSRRAVQGYRFSPTTYTQDFVQNHLPPPHIPPCSGPGSEGLIGFPLPKEVKESLIQLMGCHGRLVENLGIITINITSVN